MVYARDIKIAHKHTHHMLEKMSGFSTSGSGSTYCRSSIEWSGLSEDEQVVVGKLIFRVLPFWVH